METTPKEFGFTDFAVRQHRSLWGDAWRRLISNNTALLGIAIVIFFILFAVLSHFFWEYDPKTDLDYSLKLKPPIFTPTEEIKTIHLFGTDKLGRDIFRRVAHGGWNSLRVGLVAVGISLTVGGLLGLVAGFYESMSMGQMGRMILSGSIGLLLGVLVAWITGYFHISDYTLEILSGVEVIIIALSLALITLLWVVERLLDLVAGFRERTSPESNPFSRLRQLVFSGGGVLCAVALLVWIAIYVFPAILFCVLGLVAAFWENLLADRPDRVLLFSGVGLLLGIGPALTVSLYTAIVCGVLGLLIGGIVSLPLGGALISNIIMRVMDILLAFPGILLAIAIVAMLGPGLDKGMIAIGVVNIPVFARLTRSTVLSVVREEYVTAAMSVGVNQGRILFRHITPNTLSPVIVQSTMGLATAILSAAALGFLGLGAIPPEPEWGAMLGDSYRYLTTGAWWAVLFPGLAIMLSVLGFNLLGDGLRDALDPRLRV